MGSKAEDIQDNGGIQQYIQNNPKITRAVGLFTLATVVMATPLAIVFTGVAGGNKNDLDADAPALTSSEGYMASQSNEEEGNNLSGNEIQAFFQNYADKMSQGDPAMIGLTVAIAVTIAIMAILAKLLYPSAGSSTTTGQYTTIGSAIRESQSTHSSPNPKSK